MGEGLATLNHPGDQDDAITSSDSREPKNFAVLYDPNSLLPLQPSATKECSTSEAQKLTQETLATLGNLIFFFISHYRSHWQWKVNK